MKFQEIKKLFEDHTKSNEDLFTALNALIEHDPRILNHRELVMNPDFRQIKKEGSTQYLKDTLLHLAITHGRLEVLERLDLIPALSYSESTPTVRNKYSSIYFERFLNAVNYYGETALDLTRKDSSISLELIIKKLESWGAMHRTALTALGLSERKIRSKPSGPQPFMLTSPGADPSTVRAGTDILNILRESEEHLVGTIERIETYLKVCFVDAVEAKRPIDTKGVMDLIIKKITEAPREGVSLGWSFSHTKDDKAELLSYQTLSKLKEYGYLDIYLERVLDFLSCTEAGKAFLNHCHNSLDSAMENLLAIKAEYDGPAIYGLGDPVTRLKPGDQPLPFWADHCYEKTKPLSAEHAGAGSSARALA